VDDPGAGAEVVVELGREGMGGWMERSCGPQPAGLCIAGMGTLKTCCGH